VLFCDDADRLTEEDEAVLQRFKTRTLPSYFLVVNKVDRWIRKKIIPRLANFVLDRINFCADCPFSALAQLKNLDRLERLVESYIPEGVQILSWRSQITIASFSCFGPLKLCVKKSLSPNWVRSALWNVGGADWGSLFTEESGNSPSVCADFSWTLIGPKKRFPIIGEKRGDKIKAYWPKEAPTVLIWGRNFVFQHLKLMLNPFFPGI